MEENARPNCHSNSLAFVNNDGVHSSPTDCTITDDSSDANMNVSTGVQDGSSPYVEFSLSANVTEAVEKTGSAKASSDQMTYTINDVPPWYLCIALGFQVR